MEISTHKLSDNIVLALRSPADSTKNPTIILCHGFCGIKEILLPEFAEAFTRSGFSTITFDYRGFGDSGGERGRLVPAMQIAGIIYVIICNGSQSKSFRPAIHFFWLTITANRLRRLIPTASILSRSSAVRAGYNRLLNNATRYSLVLAHT